MAWAGVQAPAHAEPPTVTLQGSTVFNNRLIQPHRFEIEKQSEARLAVIPNKSSHGLVALLEGRADLAMISTTLEAEMALLRTSHPQLPLDRLRGHEIARTRVAFARHAANPVASLSLATIADILKGRIANWRDIGGSDLAIVVVTVHAGGGVPTTVRSQLLDGERFTPGRLIEVEAPRHVVKIVAQEPGAIGVTQLGLITLPGVAEIVTDRVVEQQLVFVTIDTPAPRVDAVIAAVRRFAEVPVR